MKKQPLDVHLHIVISQETADALEHVRLMTNQASAENGVPYDAKKSQIARGALKLGLEGLLEIWPMEDDNESED